MRAGDWSGCRYLLVVSFRRDGRPVPTPVWFAQEGDALYVSTDPDSGKVKRLRRNPEVLIAPGTARGRPLGPAVSGTARLLTGSEAQRAEAALAARYGLVRAVYRRIVTRPASAYLEIRTG